MDDKDSVDWANVSLKFVIFSFLSYFLLVTLLIIIPATLNLSMRLRERYVAGLLKIFQVSVTYYGEQTTNSS